MKDNQKIWMTWDPIGPDLLHAPNLNPVLVSRMVPQVFENRARQAPRVCRPGGRLACFGGKPVLLLNNA